MERKAFTVLSLREQPQLLKVAAQWFHSKWQIPCQAYEDKMCIRDRCIRDIGDILKNILDCLFLPLYRSLLIGQKLQNRFYQRCFTASVASHPVSYTHLDVYKRQVHWSAAACRELLPPDKQSPH